MSTALLHTPEARAKVAAARATTIANTRRTTRPGSETCDWTPGTPVRIALSGVWCPPEPRKRLPGTQTAGKRHRGTETLLSVGPRRYAGSAGWVATTRDWFRVDELTENLL